jgi:hypothetical protein
MLINKGNIMAQIINQEAYNVATSRAIVANARQTFDSTVDVDGSIARFLVLNTWSSFYASLYKQLCEHGKLSAKQVDSVRNALAKQQNKLNESEAMAQAYTPITIECFTITMCDDGAFKVFSSKSGVYMLDHFFAKTEKQAISKAKRQWAAHCKHMAMCKHMDSM